MRQIHIFFVLLFLGYNGCHAMHKDNAVAFKVSDTVTRTYNNMLKEGLNKKEIALRESSLKKVFTHINIDGIQGHVQRKKILALVKPIHTALEHNKYVKKMLSVATKANGSSDAERLAHWQSYINCALIALEEQLATSSWSNIKLKHSIKRTLEEFSDLEDADNMKEEDQQQMIAIQVYIAAGIMQAIYKNDQASFKSIYASCLDKQDQESDSCSVQ